ncbi:MAG: hypothetical protein QXT97_02600 [Candidatus Diapherotrites archaeon]
MKKYKTNQQLELYRKLIYLLLLEKPSTFNQLKDELYFKQSNYLLKAELQDLYRKGLINQEPFDEISKLRNQVFSANEKMQFLLWALTTTKFEVALSKTDKECLTILKKEAESINNQKSLIEFYL